MPRCRQCPAEIFWAWDERWQKWTPCDLESIHEGDEQYMINSAKGPALILQSHHLRHRCGLFARRPEPAAPLDPRAQAFATLYLLPEAPLEVVQAAFRALARLHHPDFGGDPERMAEINSAYEKVTGGG